MRFGEDMDTSAANQYIRKRLELEDIPRPYHAEIIAACMGDYDKLVAECMSRPYTTQWLDYTYEAIRDELDQKRGSGKRKRTGPSTQKYWDPPF
jgi:hypothetical protein